jgi:hypothetical protein
MIEKDTLLTVFGVILLSFSYGFSSAYLWGNTLESRVLGSWIPFALNGAVMVYIVAGLVNVTKISGSVRALFITLLVIMALIEVSYMYEKPQTTGAINVAWLLVTSFTLLRLYMIVSLHCDFPKSVLAKMASDVVSSTGLPTRVSSAAPKVQDTLVETKSEPDWNRAFGVLDNALRKAEAEKLITADEKLEQINKFRAAWGKPPKEVVLKGGRKR